MKNELIELTKRLLDSISDADWQTYAELCDESLTCFEPEADGNLVEGLGFHKFYFDLRPEGSLPLTANTTIASPNVRMLGDDVGIVSYIRLTQKIDPDCHRPITTKSEETRVWHRIDGAWKHVHFHRSAVGHSKPWQRYRRGRKRE